MTLSRRARLIRSSTTKLITKLTRWLNPVALVSGVIGLVALLSLPFFSPGWLLFKVNRLVEGTSYSAPALSLFWATPLRSALGGGLFGRVFPLSGPTLGARLRGVGGAGRGGAFCWAGDGGSAGGGGLECARVARGRRLAHAPRLLCGHFRRAQRGGRRAVSGVRSWSCRGSPWCSCSSLPAR